MARGSTGKACCRDFESGAGFKGARSVQNGDLGGAARKDALIESGGHMVNAKGVRCIIGYNKISKKDTTARGEKYDAIALGEHHSHICISALCRRGASIYWEKRYPKIQNRCYEPEQSKLTGQKARKVKGLLLRVCKKCHKTAKKCNGTSCLAPACRSNNLKLCQHLQ